MKIKERREQNLIRGLVYYNGNVNRRCIQYGGTCFYSPKTAGKEGVSDGCWVGKDLTQELKELLDHKYYGGSVNGDIFPLLPWKLKVLGLEFLENVQFLHDRDDHWTKKGVSAKGLRHIRNMCKTWNLDYDRIIKEVSLDK